MMKPILLFGAGSAFLVAVVAAVGSFAPPVWTQAIASVLLISEISLLGVFALGMDPRSMSKVTAYVACLAIGGLLGNAFTHLIPESFESVSEGRISVFAVTTLMSAGFLVSFVIEKALNFRCLGGNCNAPIEECVTGECLGEPCCKIDKRAGKCVPQKSGVPIADCGCAHEDDCVRGKRDGVPVVDNHAACVNASTAHGDQHENGCGCAHEHARDQAQDACDHAHDAHEHDHEHDDGHDHDHHHGHVHTHVHPNGHINVVAQSIHNLTDGMLIGGAFMVSVSAGIALTIGIVAHELANKIGTFALLVKAGYSGPAAILANLGSAMAALVGTVLVLALGSSVQQLPMYLTPIGAGLVLYIVATGLIPMLRFEKDTKRSVIQTLIVIVGFAAMAAMRLLIGDDHAH